MCPHEIHRTPIYHYLTHLTNNYKYESNTYEFKKIYEYPLSLSHLCIPLNAYIGLGQQLALFQKVAWKKKMCLKNGLALAQ